MSRKIDRSHLRRLQHALVIHDTMILTAIAAGGVQEKDLLAAFTGLFVEDLAPPPKGRGHVSVASDDRIFIALRFLLRRRLANQRIVKYFEDAAPDLCPCGKGLFVAFNRNTFLFDVLPSCQSNDLIFSVL